MFAKVTRVRLHCVHRLHTLKGPAFLTVENLTTTCSFCIVRKDHRLVFFSLSARRSIPSFPLKRNSSLGQIQSRTGSDFMA